LITFFVQDGRRKPVYRSTPDITGLLSKPVSGQELSKPLSGQEQELAGSKKSVNSLSQTLSQQENSQVNFAFM
jgi:hypothetical protein